LKSRSLCDENIEFAHHIKRQLNTTFQGIVTRKDNVDSIYRVWENCEIPKRDFGAIATAAQTVDLSHAQWAAVWAAVAR